MISLDNINLAKKLMNTDNTYVLIEVRKDGVYEFGWNTPIIKRKGLFRKFDNSTTEYGHVFMSIKNDLYKYLTENLKKNEYLIMNPVFNEFGLVAYDSLFYNEWSHELMDIKVRGLVDDITRHNLKTEMILKTSGNHDGISLIITSYNRKQENDND